MKASAIEFRLRFWIFLVIYTLGFTAPWDYFLHLDGNGPNGHVWGLLSVLLSKGGDVSIATAFDLVLAAGILCAIAGAWLRTWGSAYLGADVMRDENLRGEGIVADGPYRYLRNPLYLGSWFNLLALALLMPASGAVFTIIFVVGFQLRLILAEEAFLNDTLGDTYRTYCAQVPRLLFTLSPHLPATGGRPHWMQAVLAEIFLWGVAASYAVLGWRYNALLLIQCVLVSLGASLIVRALAVRQQPAASA